MEAMNETEITNGEHKLIWQKLMALEKYITDDVCKRLDTFDRKIDNLMWKLVLLVLGSVVVSPVTLIIALKVMEVI